MFTVDSFRNTNPARTLRKSDVRKLAESISVSLSPVIGDALSSASVVQLRPLSETDPQCTLVVADGDCLLVQFLCKNRLTSKNVAASGAVETTTFPTVFALANVVPDATQLRNVVVFATPSNVFVDYLVRGADFMLPGVRNDLSSLSFAVDDVACIAVNGVVVAVGLCLMSQQEAMAQTDRKGRLVKVLHRFGDELWQSSSRAGHETIVAALRDAVPPKASASNDATADASTTTAATAVDSATAAPAAVSAPSADELLETAFYLALVATPDSDLPLLCQAFFARVLAHRPAGTTLELKQTKHKKLLPFLQSMSAIKLVQSSPGVWAVSAIDRDSSRYEDAEASMKVAVSGAAAAAGAAASAAILHSSEEGCISVLVGRDRVSVSLPAIVSSLPTRRWPLIVELFLVDDALLGLLPAESRSLITIADAPALISGIVREHSSSVGKNTCTLNAPLAALLPDVSGTVAKKLVSDRVARLLKRCWFALNVDGMASKLFKSAVPTVHVDEVTVRGHKCTAVLGISALLDVSLTDVCDVWRTQFSSGCSVGEHMNQQNAIVVQGLHSAPIAQWLSAEFGIPDAAISVKPFKGKR